MLADTTWNIGRLTFGFSRDDAHKYLDTYLELGILKHNPFLTIDREGVGSLIEMAARKARAANPKIKIGICGEHGGDPGSLNRLEWTTFPAHPREFQSLS
jgi:pyruvate,orthophosphate dikinase